MRNLSLIVLSLVLTACSTVGNINDESDSEVLIQAPQKIEHTGTLFAKYLKDYLAKNMNPRVRTSRGVIDRSGIEANGRLPSKALYQSLGYRVRDAFVTLPPELSTRSINNPESVLLGQLIQDSETTWALLDTTKARLKSKGGLEQGRQDWEVSIVRRNLLSEAVGYWYLMRNQELYNQGVSRLDNITNTQFDKITQARQDYDVEDLRDRELALLGMRSDIALMFQFYTSEQARLYNRIDSRVLPNGGKQLLNIKKVTSCSIDTELEKKGNAFLKAQYASQIDEIRNNENKKAAVFKLNELARDISSKALAEHADKLKVVEADYLSRKASADEQRELEIERILKKQKELIELGKDVNSEQIELLRSTPVIVERKKMAPTQRSQIYYSALFVLSNWVAEQLVALNQERLETVLTEIDSLYEEYQESVWKNVSNDVGIIRELLYELYDYTLIDYLLGYERIAFANKVMLHSCNLSSELNSQSININNKAIDQFASVVDTSSELGFPKSELRNKLNNFSLFVKGITASNLGDGYSKKIISKNKPNTKQLQDDKNNKTLEDAKTKLSRNGYFLATNEEVLEFTSGEGFSVEVGAYSNVDDMLKMVKRFKRSVPKLIYVSKKQLKDRSTIFKVLIGNEKSLEEVENLHGKIEFGEIKTFEEIKEDSY